MVNRFLLYSLVVLLCGCSNQLQRATILSEQGRVNYLSNMQNWRAKGRVAIRDQDDGHTASITWTQTGPRYHLFLSNPLATETLTVTPDNINETYLYDLPVEELKYWLKGMPDPNLPIQSAQYDSNHHLKKLEQAGWEIQYLSYLAQTPLMMPDKIIANKDEITMKIIINCWEKG